jgi:hypothetical protein
MPARDRVGPPFADLDAVARQGNRRRERDAVAVLSRLEVLVEVGVVHRVAEVGVTPPEPAHEVALVAEEVVFEEAVVVEDTLLRARLVDDVPLLILV